MLCEVDYIFNLLSALNFLQPMKKIVFFFGPRVSGRLQIKPSGSGDENGSSWIAVSLVPRVLSYPSLQCEGRRENLGTRLDCHGN